MAIPTTPETWLSGYIPDLPTPFDARGAVDLTAFRRLCERQIAAGVSALVVGETAGESSTLSLSEHERIIRAHTSIGTVEGFTRDGVNRWRSIPYAQAPLGRLRFRAPLPARKSGAWPPGSIKSSSAR